VRDCPELGIVAVQQIQDRLVVVGARLGNRVTDTVGQLYLLSESGDGVHAVC